MSTRTSIVSRDQLKEFKEEGSCVLKCVIDQKTLELLREECSYFLGYIDATMDHQKTTSIGITHRGSRYFISNRYRESRRMGSFIFGDLMATITKDILGDEVYLFNEQWVVKGPEQGMKFAWHQDSGYVKYRDPGTIHPPYLTCWCALDDVDEINGTAYIMPHSRGGTRDVIHPHYRESTTNDLVGYEGTDPGDPIVAPAGSIALFSSYNLHRSGTNASDQMRRVYLPQYSSGPIQNSSGQPWGMAVPFISNKKIVYQADQDTAENYGPFRG